MARNEEKAQSMLYRFREAKNAELGLSKTPDRRPRLASDVSSLSDAERWRLQVLREVSRKVSKIQDPGLTDYQIRDLNDEINKFMREKMHWERRIMELGGPDYFRIGPKMLDHQGKEVPGNRGYKYFGRARDLPGVRELFEQETPEPENRTRGDLYKQVDADYYGYRDEEDGLLLQFEKKKESIVSQLFLSGKFGPVVRSEDFGNKKRSKKRKAEVEVASDGGESESEEEDEEDDEEGVTEENNEADEEMPQIRREVDTVLSSRPEFVKHVNIPSQKDVEEFLVRRRKRDLLDRYTDGDENGGE